jgi:hypothetical protein
MNIGEILIWEATNGLLLIPLVIAVVMLIRWLRRRPVFTELDWLFFSAIFGKCLLAKMWRAMGRVRLSVLLPSCRLDSRHSLVGFSHRACTSACCVCLVSHCLSR